MASAAEVTNANNTVVNTAEPADAAATPSNKLQKHARKTGKKHMKKKTQKNAKQSKL